MTTLRKGLYGEASLSYTDLEDHCKRLTTCPDALDKPFVLQYVCDAANEMFRMVFSTRRLIELAKRVQVLVVDATYKLIVEGFPLIICGTIDMMRQFHPICAMIASSEDNRDFTYVFEAMKVCFDWIK